MRRTIYIRLDDACPKRDIRKWDKIEKLLDRYNIKPLVGVIPDCKDPAMEKYDEDSKFWLERIQTWQKKGWVLAMHGYEHVFCSHDGGINPVNQRSEFAGLPLSEPRKKIQNGIRILNEHGIMPQVFFAPAHTFDINTLESLRLDSEIRIISDSPANDIYTKYGFTFIPQQAGHVRNLPFKTTTFCYHPNVMQDEDFKLLEDYIRCHSIDDFVIEHSDRRISLYDRALMKLYYMKHKLIVS